MQNEIRQSSKNPEPITLFERFTEVEFEAFVPCFEYHWKEYYSHYTLSGKPRQRISYNRKTSKIPLTKDKLLFILSYLKNNRYRYHGATYDMAWPQCNRWVHLLSEIYLKRSKRWANYPIGTTT